MRTRTVSNAQMNDWPRLTGEFNRQIHSDAYTCFGDFNADGNNSQGDSIQKQFFVSDQHCGGGSIIKDGDNNELACK